MVFNNISQLMKKLEYDLAVSLNKDVADEVIEVYQKHIEDDVYSYPSEGYRRYDQNGGFADPTNIEKALDIKGSRVSLEIKNNAKARGENRGEYLDEIIEYGEKYSYGSIGARPVAENTIEEIENTGLVEEVLKSSLKRKGYDVG